MPKLLSQRGRFSISKELLESNSKPVFEVMAKILVVRAEFMFDRNCFEYIALSKLFREVDDAELTPEYKIIFHTDKKGGFKIEFQESH